LLTLPTTPKGLNLLCLIANVNEKGVTMQDIAELIDRASQVAGSDNKLAKLIDAHQQHISQWRSGAKPCPPADVALMASVAGLNADEWLVRAVMAKHEGTPKGEKLMRVLKASLLTGAVIGSGSAMAGTISSAYGMVTDLWLCCTMYI
jgi:hypothetical protein